MGAEGHNCWEDCDEGPHGCVCGNACLPPLRDQLRPIFWEVFDPDSSAHGNVQAALDAIVPMVEARIAALRSEWEAEQPKPHDHKDEPMVWCETHQHEHIARMPRFTYLCKDCGWGQWYGDDAREHESWTQENLREAHTTYEVEHVMRPLAEQGTEEPEWEYGLTWEPDVTGDEASPASYTGCETEEGAWETGRRLAGTAQTPIVWKRPMRPAVQAIPAGPWVPVGQEGESDADHE